MKHYYSKNYLYFVISKWINTFYKGYTSFSYTIIDVTVLMIRHVLKFKYPIKFVKNSLFN